MQKTGTTGWVLVPAASMPLMALLLLKQTEMEILAMMTKAGLTALLPPHSATALPRDLNLPQVRHPQEVLLRQALDLPQAVVLPRDLDLPQVVVGQDVLL